MNRQIRIFILLGMFLMTGCTSREPVLTAEEHITESIDISGSASEEQLVYVYVCGQVEQPGVYALENDARICDALELAGGVTKEARSEVIEQAKFVEDGQTIYVPSLQETEAYSEETDGLVDINKADKEMLMTLPGIGESKADIILQYREEHGSFQTIEDLKKIPGIKEGVFNKIKNGIKVS